MPRIKLKETRDCTLCWECISKGSDVIETNDLIYHKECIELLERPEFGMNGQIFSHRQRIMDENKRFKEEYGLNIIDRPRTTEELYKMVNQLLDCYKNSNNLKYLKRKYKNK